MELAAQGATLALSARRKDKLDAIIEKLEGQGHLALPANAADPASLVDVLAKISETFPHLDSAVFMAAIYGPHDGKPKPLPFIHEMIAVNLGGAFNMIDAVLPRYEQQNFGQIALCASIAGYRGLPTGQPYCATKAALINLAESLKVDLEPKNIDVKVINPGFVKTPLTDKNNFHMPMMIEASEAATAIAKGLRSKKFEIHFPKKFTLLMKLLRIMPNGLYFSIARRIRPK